MNETDLISKKFFAIILLAIGKITDIPFIPSSQDWVQIYTLAKEQALLGICFAGVQKIYEQNPEALSNLPKSIKMQWFALATNIQNRNKIINNQCATLQKDLLTQGLNSCILKGHGVAYYYGKGLDLLRQPGDIDIWVNGSWKQVMALISKRTPNREFDLKHAHYNVFKDTPVEVHWVPSTTSNFFLDRKLKRFYRQQANMQFNHKVTLYGKEEITAADPFFDSIHLLLHILGHYLYEGVGLRQVMDYYFIIKQEDVQKRKKDIIAYYKTLGLYDFSKSVMWVLKEVFALENDFLFVEPDAKNGKKLLNEILKEGNMGHAATVNKVNNETTLHRWIRRWKRKIRLIKYNKMGVLCNPFYKAKLLWWKHRVIKLYNL